MPPSTREAKRGAVQARPTSVRSSVEEKWSGIAAAKAVPQHVPGCDYCTALRLALRPSNSAQSVSLIQLQGLRVQYGLIAPPPVLCQA
jgi:hypothetical protein